MTETPVSGGPSRGLAGNSVGLLEIVFFVVAAAAPMTAVVGATPPAFAFGNGAGVPGAFLLAGVLYLIFSVGFTAMARHVTSAGAFYTYITRGVGIPAGLGGAFMALTSYFCVQIGIYGLFSVFIAAAVAPLGIVIPWWCWAVAVLAVVTLFGQRNISISGKILGICMLAETAILLLLDGAILIHGGGDSGMSVAGFRPSEVFQPSLGITMVFVLGAFIGFEATAIFGEEAKNPKRTIPLATYTAVGLITLFYALSTWAIVQYYGADKVQSVANASLNDFYFAAAQKLLGGWSVQVMNLLMLSSLFACLLSFHNTLNRYFYALAREGLAWQSLGLVHSRHGSPHVAGLVQAGLVLLVLVAFAAAGTDPYTVIFSWMSALAVLGILGVQVLVSIAVILFFRRTKNEHSIFTTLIAPALSCLGLAAAFYLVASKLSLLTGSESMIVRLFPAAIIGVGVIGALIALRLRSKQPALYARLGQVFD